MWLRSTTRRPSACARLSCSASHVNCPPRDFGVRCGVPDAERVVHVVVDGVERDDGEVVSERLHVVPTIRSPTVCAGNGPEHRRVDEGCGLVDGVGVVVADRVEERDAREVVAERLGHEPDIGEVPPDRLRHVVVRRVVPGLKHGRGLRKVLRYPCNDPLDQRRWRVRVQVSQGPTWPRVREGDQTAVAAARPELCPDDASVGGAGGVVAVEVRVRQMEEPRHR